MLPVIAMNADSPATDVASTKGYGIEILLTPDVAAS
jgi:hypothetical protein